MMYRETQSFKQILLRGRVKTSVKVMKHNGNKTQQFRFQCKAGINKVQ